MSKKKIIMVGVLDVESSTNISQAKAFIDLGYDIIPINYRTLISTYGTAFFNSTLHTAIDKHKPYFVMFCKFNGVDPTIVKECSKKCKTMLWNPDYIGPGMERYPEMIEHAKYTNFSACTGLAVVEYFQSHGVENCYHIFDGVDTDIFKPVEPFTDFCADIAFIGTRLPERDKYLELLADAGYKVKAYGNGYGGEVFNNRFSTVCSSSQVMLSINTINSKEGFSNRLLRYLGCKVCTAHFDPTETLHKYFKDGEEIILFKDQNELITKLKFYKNKYHTIAENGYKLVTSKYTWHESCKKILDLVEKC